MTDSTTALAPASTYRDRKRYAWLLSILVPMLAAVGPALYLLTDEIALLWLPVAFNYLVIPAADYLMGPDRSNPPESAVPALEADPYYRTITYLLVPILWLTFIFSAWFVVRYELPWYGMLAMVFTTGGVGGYCINLGHELGHKRSETERWLAKIVLAVTGYGHFFIEHNRGHHRDVATPDDPASSRMGESIYRFVMREMPGALRRAWNLEKDRLNRGGRSVWSYENEILQPLAITMVLWSALIAWLGIGVVPFLLLASFWANFQLTSANYVEHYGLLRQRLANGKVRDVPAASLVEQQSHLLELGGVPPATPFGPPCASGATLSVIAPLRGSAAAAEWLLRHVPDRLCAAAVVLDHGLAPVGSDGSRSALHQLSADAARETDAALRIG